MRSTAKRLPQTMKEDGQDAFQWHGQDHGQNAMQPASRYPSNGSIRENRQNAVLCLQRCGRSLIGCEHSVCTTPPCRVCTTLLCTTLSGGKKDDGLHVQIQDLIRITEKIRRRLPTPDPAPGFPLHRQHRDFPALPTRCRSAVPTSSSGICLGIVAASGHVLFRL